MLSHLSKGVVSLVFVSIVHQAGVSLLAQDNQPLEPETKQRPAASPGEPIPESAKADRRVVVTATLKEAEPEATATSTTVITRSDLERRQIRNIADAVRSSPGVAVASNGTPGQAAGLFIRGAKTQNNLVKLNGRRLPFNLAGAFNLEDFSTSNVERIEIARGPLSSVHGGPAIGGVVNIVTRDGRDSLEPISGSVRAEGGSYQTFAEAVEAHGATGPWDYSIEYNRFDSDFQRTNNQYRRNSLLGKTGFQISGAVYADVLFYYNTTDAGSPGAVPSNIAAFGLPDDPNDTLERETWMISPSLEIQPASWWTQTTYYSHSQSRQVATGFNRVFGLNFGQNNRIQVDTDEVESRGDFQIAENWSVSAGASWTSERYYRRIDVPNQFVFPATPAGTKDIEDTRTNVGVFAETQWEPLENWFFVGNVRWDHYSDFDQPITWRVGSSYTLPGIQTTLHGNYGWAYAPPTPQDVAPVFGGVANLEAETSRGWEVGITQPLFENRIELFGTFFRNEVRDLIEFRPAAPGFLPFNVGEATLEGVETGVAVRWIPEVEVRLDYTYLTATDDDANTRLVRRPRHLLNAQVAVFPVEAVTVSLDATWVVDREDVNPTTFAQVDNEDYLVMRLAGAWQVHEHVRIFGRVENLTNDQYQEVLGFPALDQAAYGGVEVLF